MNAKLRKLWNLSVGSMDACTGLLLICAPAFTLRVMGMNEVPAASLIYLSWIGCFVFAVGCAYFFAIQNELSHGVLVWQFTGLARITVGLFLVWKIAMGLLEARWLIVAFTDLIVAFVQCVGLYQKWENR